MKYKLNLRIVVVILCLYMFVIGIFAAEENNCEAAESCKACLDADGNCKWCADPDYNKKDARIPRCNTKQKLKENNCKDIQIKDGQVLNKSKEDFGPRTQVVPKRVTLTLRPGEKQTFTLSVKPADNYPVRLYYLMDMSNSMKDDLEKLQTLGTQIANEIKKLTNNFQLAFGTFVDKTVTPFIQLAAKNEPCDGCEPTFGYQHIFDFNKDAKLFENAVAKQKISGNLDTPEGGFDALMQVAVCGDKIWPKEDFSRKIVVFVTDATPHIAGDGKIGGITVPNDGQCHLSTKTAQKPMMYSKTNDMDYPSISLLREKMKENKIVPIIAITKDVEPIYKKLQEEWKDLGTGLGPLEKDSSNIVALIRDNYKKISTTVRLSDNSPANLVVKYKVIGGCPSSDKDNECTGVAIGHRVDFKVEVKATNCPDNWKDGQMFKIAVPGFGEMEVDVKYICTCDCDKAGSGEVSSPKCNGTGTFKCGICDCDEGRFGKHCECDSESQADTSLCIMPNSTNKAICSGFGTCVCGKCECNEQSKDPSKKISGTYCQCNNFGCDRYNGKICGGPERGLCKCGKCVCNEAFQGENCGTRNCTLGAKECLTKEGKVCSGHGKCNCDTCECEIGYNGKHCETCVSCAGKCENNEDCVLCHTPYNKGKKSVCDACRLKIQLVNNTDPIEYGKKKCSVSYNETCRVFFSFHSSSTGNETVYVEDKPRCVIVIAGDAPILIIVLGIIGGIVLVGLLLLLAWKLIVTAYDQHEYHKFEKDRMKSKWENAENPIYRPSKQQFQNPAYAGNK